MRAQAVNELGPSEWGIYSSEDNPAGVPAAPAAPTSAVASAVGTTNQLRVNWTEPDTNGDAIRNYYVTMSGGGGAPQTQTIAGTVRTANFTANNSEAEYTFTVQAENKAGKGAVSPPSAPRRATGKLGQVSGVSAAAADTGGAGRQVTINFKELTAAERNGSAYGEVSYSYNASTGQSGPDQARADGRRLHQRHADHHHGDRALHRGAELQRQRRSFGHPLRFTRYAVGSGQNGAHEPEVADPELVLTVHHNQRRCFDQDQHRQRRLGKRCRVRQQGHQHRRIRRVAIEST